MDLRVVSTGKQFFQVDPTLAAILIEAFPAAFERVEKKQQAPQPLVAKYGITMLDSGYPAILRSQGQQRNWFDFWPQFVYGTFPDCPVEVVRAYTRQWVGPSQRFQSPKNAAEELAKFKKKIGV